MADYEQCKYIYTGSRRVRPGFYWKLGRFLGMLQCLFGVLSISCQMLQWSEYAPWSLVGTAGWGGALFMVSGTCGIIASHFRTDCSIHSFNVGSALSTLTALLLLVFNCLDLTYEPGGKHFVQQRHEKQNIFIICLISVAVTQLIVGVASCVICSLGTFFGPASVAVTYEIPAEIKYASSNRNIDHPGRSVDVQENTDITGDHLKPLTT